MPRVFRDLSFGTKAVLFLAFGAVTPVAVATAVTFFAARASTQQQAEHLLAARADQLASEIDAFHRNYRGIAGRNARRGMFASFLKTGGDPASPAAREAMDVLASFLNDGQVRGVVIASPAGKVVLTTEREALGVDLSARDYMAATLKAERGQSTVSDIFLAIPLGGEIPLVAYGAPIYEPDGPLLGAFLIYVRASSLWDLVRAVNGRAGESSYAVVLDGAGIRVAHSFRDEHLFRPTAPLPPADVDAMVRHRRFGERTRSVLESPIPAPEQHRLATSPWSDALRGAHRVFAPALAQWTMAVAQRLREINWTVLVVVPEDAVMDLAAGPMRRGLLVVAGIVALWLFAGTLLARLWLRPLQALGAAADAMGAGDLTTRVAVHGDDELGQLGRRFNEMAAALADARTGLEDKVRERTAELERANEELLAQRRELQVQQRELEEKNREVAHADKLKSQFLTNMSHELRTPLNSVIGFAELVLDEGKELSPRHRQFLSDVLASGRHLLALINDILDLSKIEAARLDLHLDAVRPADIVRDACQMIAPVAQRKGVQIRQRVTARSPAQADVNKLRQILINLLSNAIKFSPDGAEVAIGAEDAGPFVRFWIRDHGPGIDHDLRPRLFEPFVQGENPLVKKHQGTGLGLAISKRLVEHHGGAIEYDTELGKGTVFRFTIPTTATATAEITPAPVLERGGAPTGAADPARRQRGRVLVIDDDPAVGELLADVLRPAGYDVEVAATGRAGLVAARDRPPAVAIVDLRLPDVSGFEVVELLAADPATARCSVVVLSAMDLSQDERERLAPHVEVIAAKGDVVRRELLAVLRRLTGAETRPPGGSATILVVDDHDMNRELARSILERLGYAVHLANDGEAGVALARELRPALIFMDLAMPRKDGYAATRELKDDPATRGIPIVALTALAMTGDEDKARAAGVDGYLTKPVNRRALEEIVARFVHGHAAPP